MRSLRSKGVKILKVDQKGYFNINLDPGFDYYFNLQPSPVFVLEVFKHDKDTDTVTNQVYKINDLIDPKRDGGDLIFQTDILRWKLIKYQCSIDINTSSLNTDGVIESIKCDGFNHVDYTFLGVTGELVHYGVNNASFKQKVVDTNIVNNPDFNIDSLGDKSSFVYQLDDLYPNNFLHSIYDWTDPLDSDTSSEYLYDLFIEDSFNNCIIKFSQFTEQLNVSVLIKADVLCVPKISSILNAFIA